MWRYGGDDWTIVWRVYHGLGPDFRPADDPNLPPRFIRYMSRYRNLLYGFAKAAAIIEEGAKDRDVAPRPKRRKPDPGKPREEVSPGGVVLPTGRPRPEG